MLLLHGGFGSWTHFIRIIPYIAQDRMVLCPDLPGYGDSDLPVSEDLANSIPAALVNGLMHFASPDETGFDEIDIVAFSFGCSIAGLLCERLTREINGPKPRGLVLYGPSALGLGIRRVDGTRRLGHGLSLAERERVHATNLSLVMLKPGNVPDPATIRLQDLNVRRTRVRGKPLSHSGVLRDVLSSRPVRAIAAVWGVEDPYLAGLHADYEKLLTQLFPDAQIHIQHGCGHWVQQEAAEATATITRSFFDAIPPAGRSSEAGPLPRQEQLR